MNRGPKDYENNSFGIFALQSSRILRGFTCCAEPGIIYRTGLPNLAAFKFCFLLAKIDQIQGGAEILRPTEMPNRTPNLQPKSGLMAMMRGAYRLGWRMGVVTDSKYYCKHAVIPSSHTVALALGLDHAPLLHRNSVPPALARSPCR